VTIVDHLPFLLVLRKVKEQIPRKLVAAAQAGCYSMFLSALISGENLTPQSIETTVTVTLGKDDIGPCITNINLVCNVTCEGLSQEKFDDLALATKGKCPISRLYADGTAKIDLDANLVGWKLSCFKSSF